MAGGSSGGPVRLSRRNIDKLSGGVKGSSFSGGSSRPSVARDLVKPSPYNYKKLMSEKSFLQVQRRAKRVQGIDLVSIDFAGRELRFLVNSVSRRGLRHTVIVQFNDISDDVVDKIGTLDLARLLRLLGLRVYCSCEAWLYWGYQYKSERQHYAAFRMGVRFPKVRNPLLQGYLCKHTYAVLSVLSSGTLMNSISRKLKDYVSRERLERTQEVISDSLKRVRVIG